MAHWLSRTTYPLPDSAMADVEFLLGTLADLPHVIGVAEGLRPGFQVGPLFEAIAQETGHSTSELRRIFNTLENILDLRDEAGDANAAVELLLLSVSPALASKISASKEALSTVLTLYGRNNPVSITLKAQRLTYLRERLFHEGEIVTDTRPVFDSSGETILQFVITHSLVISTLVDGRFVRQHISLDNADIVHLREACDRAILKAKTLKQALDKHWTTEILRDA